MSKFQELYEQGIQRLCEYLDILLQEPTLPELSQIQAEIQAIPGFKRIATHVSASPIPLQLPEGFFFLLQENYERYDDSCPASLQVLLLPNSLSEPKELNKFLFASHTTP